MPDARVDLPGEQAGQVGDQPAEGVDQVDGELRARGVPAGAGQRDVDPVAGRGDGPGAQPDGARPAREGSQCRANAREAPSSTPEATTSMAPPGMVSSAGWKTQPHRAGQAVERGQGGATPSSDGRVHVVPAGVAQALAGRGVGRRPSGRPAAARRCRPAGRPPARRSRPRRPARCRSAAAAASARRRAAAARGRTVVSNSANAELRVGVQVPAGGDQLRVVRGDPVVDGGAQLLDDRGHAACPPAAVRARAGRPASRRAGCRRPAAGRRRAPRRPRAAAGRRRRPRAPARRRRSSASQPSRFAVGIRSSTRSRIACRTGRTVPFSSTTISASSP